MQKVIFWQVNPSQHLSDFMRSLPELRPDLRVTAVFQRDPSPSRLAIGWDKIEFGRVHTIMSPDSRTIDALVNAADTVHVFSGMTYNAVIRRAFRACLKGPGLIGELSEGRNYKGIKGKARLLDSFRHERSYRNEIDFVLAIGGVGARWYRRCGFADQKIFSFCYVVEAPRSEIQKGAGKSIELENDNTVRILYVGRLLGGKRVDLLIDALAQVRYRNWQLVIIGDGEERDNIQKRIEKRKLSEHVILKGQKKNEAIWNYLAISDLLIFPSEIDGWGAVVNEAMMAGVPVISSDYCGAADLIQPGFNGDTFKCGSRESLTETVENWIELGRLEPIRRKRIQDWAQCISGKAVAEYFLNIIEYVNGDSPKRPLVPWFVK